MEVTLVTQLFKNKHRAQKCDNVLNFVKNKEI